MNDTAQRSHDWEAVLQTTFDVAIIGGGINGACLYHELCGRGYRTLLIERGDFASGASGSSAMWVWGGLRYLQSADLRLVTRLCASRDRMVKTMGGVVCPQTFRLLVDGTSGSGSWGLLAGLYLYWILGRMRRTRPRREKVFPERGILRQLTQISAIAYEEATVGPSDARFVLNWILPNHSTLSPALNYGELRGGGWDNGAREWRLEIIDRIGYREGVARARCVVNAAGCWTDRVNQRFGRETPWRHRFGKGTFIAVKRDAAHLAPLVIRTRSGAAMTLIPWGPVALWGPLDEFVARPEEGFQAEAGTIARLLDELNQRTSHRYRTDEIVSIRSGVRPLAIPRGFGCEALPVEELSRRSHIYRDSSLPWISVYGGKLTNCIALAEAAARQVRATAAPSGEIGRRAIARLQPSILPELAPFPGLSEAMPSARWCRRHEMCWTLEDYLRRRTNIAQWIPNAGFGRRWENSADLRRLAAVFADNEAAADRMLKRYARKVERDARALRQGMGVLEEVNP